MKKKYSGTEIDREKKNDSEKVFKIFKTFVF